MKGRDGQVRGATVKMAIREQQKRLLRRAIQLLYPLKVKGQGELTLSPTESDITGGPAVLAEDSEKTMQDVLSGL